MSTRYLRLVLAGLTMVTIAPGAAAQDRAALLTSIEVQLFVASDQPNEHARLRDHFAALADKYAADARRHKAMAQTFTGNPNHPPAVPPGAHHSRLADSTAAAATALRELSNHHGRLAAGLPSQAPEIGERFEKGEGAPPPNEAQLREARAAARTPRDHQVLEAYFAGLADEYMRAAQRHTAMARSYRGQPNDRSGSFTALAAQFDQMAKRSRESAARASAAAADHRQFVAPR